MRDSLDLSSTVIAGGMSNSRSAMFIPESENIYAQRDYERLRLTPVEFICQHHDIVEKVTELLTRKNGHSFEPQDRDKLYKSSYNDVVALLSKERLLPVGDYVSAYVEIIFADIFGFGVLEYLLYDPQVDEIVVQAHDNIYAEISGSLVRTPIRFPSVENAKSIVSRIISPLNKTLSASNPNVDCQMPDGSRLSASIAPLRANNEISINIRKFKSSVEPLQYYVKKYKSQAPEMAEFLEDCIRYKLSALVSGGTGSGKTTLLNSLSIAIPPAERIITVEDTLELQLQQDDVESYQTIEPNMEGKGGFSMQQVIIATLRKRPDRIIVGECRGPEIVEMLNAMNTGHEGSLSTIHANSPQEMVMRASTMIRSNPSSSHLGERSINDMLATVSLIIQTNRLADGSRKVMNITEVVGVGKDGFYKIKEAGMTKPNEKPEDKLYLQDIFRFVQTGVDDNGKVHGYFETTGYVPQCASKLNRSGCSYPDAFFNQRRLMEV